MPISAHLQWFEITDFTAGVWDVAAAYAKFASPAQAFVTLDDYQPVKGGGLRAFVLPTAIDMTNVGATEIPLGIFARNGWNRSAGNGGTGTDSTDMVLVTIKPGDFKFRVYRRDGSVASPAWSLRFTSAAGSSTGSQVTAFEYFKDVNGKEWYIMSITAAGSASGVYKMQADNTTTSNDGVTDGVVTAITTAMSGPICVSQARIFMGSGGSLFWTDTTLTTSAAGFTKSLPVAINRGEPAISIISGIEPSDLLLGKEGAPWVQISGDVTLSSTPVREMSATHYPRQDKQQVPRTPGGICFIEPGGRVFETDGRNFKSLSDQIQGRSLNWSNGMVGAGTMACLNELLFVPGQNADTKGLVYDFSSGAWFRATSLNHVFNWADPYGGNVWSVNHSAAGVVYSYNLFGGTKVSTGVIQTAPYADKNGRNIDIREVQLFVNCYDVTEFKVELIDENDASVVTRYAVVPTAHRELVKLQFPATKSEYLSVRITPTAQNSAEAPTFERIRIGFGINNLVN